MKLQIKVTQIFPDNPPTEKNPYPTRNQPDIYDQTIELDESCVSERLKNIIKAFNNFGQ